jgi:hypothetical protein
VIPTRRIDLHGSIETHDADGHRAVLNFHANRITVELDSIRAALAARRAARSAVLGTGVLSAGPSLWLSAIAEKAKDFELHICIRGRTIAAAGAGVRPNWLGTRLAGFPLNVHVRALLGVMLRVS